ncbi:MAG: hypothetical protein IT228_14455 [Flavobacteriales bacterium]|nr:hypothetical protein [Flavobacteriales bacterium]MCC6578539.1 hypothetical protein [Flavobacteriales bacterium]NUQ15614.1 hypothetical protein [Flavobacteriales bacterium]
MRHSYPIAVALLCGLLFHTTAQAQPQMNNAGFENWQNLGTGTEEPTDWSSIKTSDGGTFINNLAPQVCWRSTDFHSGSYSVRLKTASTAFGPANGTLTCGRVHAEITPANGYVFTDAGDAQWNQAITSRPDSLVGWFKATPQPGDEGKVEAILHVLEGKLPENGTLPNWIGRARWIAPSAVVGTWTRFSVPFTYYNSGTPSHILMVLTSGDSLVTVVNSESWYDDIALIYNLTATPSVNSVALNGTDPVGITVNYSSGGVPTGSTLFTAQLSDASGSFASPQTIGFVGSSSASGAIGCSIPGNTPPGTGYRIRVVASGTAFSAYYAPVSVPFTINSTAVVRVAAKVFLDGPYVSGTQLMNDNLRSQGIVPLVEPYTAIGYTHVGGGAEVTTAPVLAVTGNNAIVDWVVLELRDKNNSATVLRSRSALVQRDGDVVDVDGVSSVPFAVAADNYFVAVRHRNHLGCMTATSIALSGTAASVDFTNNATATYGTNARRVNGARSTLWKGNARWDAVVKYAGGSNDRDVILTAVGGTVPTATVTGYRSEDVNMDGTTKYAGGGNDRDLILQVIGGTVPTATKAQQLP